MGITQILFWFLSVVALFSALMVITSKNPVYSVLWLIATFFAISGHYILLNAQFLAIDNLDLHPRQQHQAEQQQCGQCLQLNSVLVYRWPPSYQLTESLVPKVRGAAVSAPICEVGCVGGDDQRMRSRQRTRSS